MKTSKKMSVSENDNSCEIVNVAQASRLSNSNVVQASSLLKKHRQDACSTLIKTVAIVAISAICASRSFAQVHQQSFSLEKQELPEGKTMSYICVRGRVTDPAVPEIPERDYSGKEKGVSLEGVIVWLKRNPSLRAITDDNGIFEIVCENGVLAQGKRGEDDLVCAWKPGYEFTEQSILVKYKPEESKSREYRRDSLIRTWDYDATRYFRLKRNKDWEDLYGKGQTPKIRKKTLDRMISKNSFLLSPFRSAIRLPDGRVALEVNLKGTITDSKTGKPVQDAGIWLKRNPTLLALTDENGKYSIKMPIVGLRGRTKELSDTICASAGNYKTNEVLVPSYKGKVSFTLEKQPKLQENGDFIKMVNIPNTSFRMGSGLTQGGGGARDCGHLEFYCWMYYPVRTVTLPAFSIGKYPTTLGQYDKVREWGEKNGYEIQDIKETPGLGKYKSYDYDSPVSMNWVEAIKWCNAASEMEGRTPCYYTPHGDLLKTGLYNEPQVKWDVDGYRLPTKAEWEYAGTAGTHFTHYWKEGYSHILEHTNKTQFMKDTVATVGKSKPNPFGLYNIIGSGDWCWNWQAPIKGDDTFHPKGGTKAEAMQWNRSIIYGHYVPWKGKGGACRWSIGPIWGEIAWDDIRLNWAYPSEWNLSIRPVVSSERGNTKLQVLFDRQYDLPKPINLNKITEKIEFVDIPKGNCLMGGGTKAKLGKNKRIYDQRPEHIVYISKFQMAKYETTLEQWNFVYEWALKNGYNFDNKGNMGEASSDNIKHPVVNVNWYDMIKWCNAASEMNNIKPCYYIDAKKTIIYRSGNIENITVDWNCNGYRLPTEAEWEYAALGGEDAAYYWGDYRDKKYAWFAGWYGDSNTDYPLLQNYAKSCPAGKLGTPQQQPNPKWATHPVGQKIGNRFGLYDVFGNVWEMCWDWAAPFNMIIDERVNPKGPRSVESIKYYMKNPILLEKRIGSFPIKKDLNVKIIKGSCYLTSPSFHGPYLSDRSGLKINEINKDCGFRIARSYKNEK